MCRVILGLEHQCPAHRSGRDRLLDNEERPWAFTSFTSFTLFEVALRGQIELGPIAIRQNLSMFCECRKQVLVGVLKRSATTLRTGAFIRDESYGGQALEYKRLPFDAALVKRKIRDIYKEMASAAERRQEFPDIRNSGTVAGETINSGNLLGDMEHEPEDHEEPAALSFDCEHCYGLGKRLWDSDNDFRRRNETMHRIFNDREPLVLEIASDSFVNDRLQYLCMRWRKLDVLFHAGHHHPDVILERHSARIKAFDDFNELRNIAAWRKSRYLNDCFIVLEKTLGMVNQVVHDGDLNEILRSHDAELTKCKHMVNAILFCHGRAQEFIDRRQAAMDLVCLLDSEVLERFNNLQRTGMSGPDV